MNDNDVGDVDGRGGDGDGGGGGDGGSSARTRHGGVNSEVPVRSELRPTPMGASAEERATGERVTEWRGQEWCRQ